MDKSWDENPLKSGVIGRCGTQNEWPRRTDKSNAKFEKKCFELLRNIMILFFRLYP